MQLVAVQLDIAWEDWSANVSAVAELLAGVELERGAVVALPEMFASGFSMDVGKIADREPGRTEAFLCATARRLGVWLIGGMACPGADGKGRNLAVVAGPEGEIAARYQKIHPFSPGGEAQHYTGGEAVITFEAGGMKAAPLVCYDLRFGEVFRAGTARGAECFIVIANWPAERIEHWVTLLRARALENQAYVMGVNRCGRDPSLAYPGRSLIVDYRGAVLADAGAEAGIISASIDAAGLRQYRRELPFLADAKRDLGKLFG